VTLMVKHAAGVAARCQAVVHPQMKDSGPATDVRAGVMMLLGAIPGGVSDADVSVKDSTADQYSFQRDTEEVTVVYHCSIPLGNVIACGASRTKTIVQQASFPNQGSQYQKIWKDS
jgi:hypothetical protein